MTRLAKAMSAFNFGRSASADGRDARSFAGRGTSSGIDGSGVPSLTLVPALLAAALLLGLAVPTAAHAQSTTYSHSGQFGGAGSAPGLFNQATMPQRMAVHEESGKLFVADRGNHRVQVFSPTASGVEFDFQIDVPAPIGVAIDQSTGDLYVTHPAAAARNEVQQIQIQNASAGTYSLAFEGDTTGATATGDLSGASGTGDLTRTPSSQYTRTAGSPILTDVANIATFAVGMRITGTGIPANAAITAVDVPGESLTLNQNATGNGTAFGLVAGGIQNATGGPFTVGQTIVGAGIPANTTILAVAGGTITPSNVPTAAATEVTITAGSTTVSNVTLDSGAISVGQAISGPGIAPGTTITACVPANCVAPTGLTLSTPPGATTTGAALTTAIPFNAAAAAVQAALRALPSINGANVNVSGALGNDTLRTRTVTFVGSLAGTDVSEITADASALNAEASITVSTTTQGDPAQPAQIRKLNPNNSTNPTVYTPDVTFTSPPIGTGSGEIGAFQSGPNNMANGGGIVVDPTTADILVADPGRNLIQRFDSDGDHLDDFDGASGGRPAFAGVRDLAVTSTGDIVVADVASGQGRVDRFNADGMLQATLSQNNNPVPNPNIGSSFFNWAITLGVNRTTDEVFVSSVASDGGIGHVARVYQFADDEQVADFAAPANFGGPLYGIVGGTDPARLYVMAAASLSFGSVGIPRVQVFNAAIPPAALIDPVDPDDVTATEATFTGAVNPNGSPTAWRFEHRPVGATAWTEIPLPHGDAGDGTDEVPVQATAENLEPNTEYEVRLVASAPPDVVTISDPPNPTFATDSAPPVIDTGTASFLGDTGATLTGGVNPRNSETSYFFQYGLDDSYGEVVPVDPEDIGSGGVRVAVTEAIEGLEPAATYHFRIVAENEFGQVGTGDDMTFTTLAATPGGLGAARAWEVVSQIPTGGRLALGGFVSEDGDRASYRSEHQPGHELPHSRYLAVRGEGGWNVEGADLPNPARIEFSEDVALPADFSRVLARSTASHDPDDQNGIGGDLYLREPGGDLTWVTRSRLVEPGEPQTDAANVRLAGLPQTSALSADGSILVFLSQRRLLEDDPHPSGAASRLYKWTADGSEHGRLELASVRPDGSAPAGVALGSLGTLGSLGNSPNAVSRDGSRVFWSDGTTIYAQIDGQDPIEVGTGTYAGATPDGSRVVYHGGGRVWSFEVNSETVNDLTGPAGVLGVATVAADGSRAYFVATTALDSEASPLGKLPTAGENNLYLVDLDEAGEPVRTRFIATLGGSGTGADGNVWGTNFDTRAAATNPDGVVLALGSVRSLTGEPTAGTRQLYLYDDLAGSLVCASCPSDGSPPAAGNVNANLLVGGADQAGTSGWAPGGAYGRMVAPDGTVFFSTRTALVPDDENETRDVYEYRNGELRLVSRGGSGDFPTALTGASADGKTVFFLTSEQLAVQDTEPGTQKLYAARVGGGFPVQAPTPDCTGDSCQGAPGPAPEFTSPASGFLSSPASGDPEARGNGREARISIKRLTRAQARRLFSGRAISIEVKTSGPGPVVVLAQARLQRDRTVRVARATGRANRSGKATVRGLRLNRRAQRILRNRGGFQIRILARYRGEQAGQRLRTGNPQRLRRRG